MITQQKFDEAILTRLRLPTNQDVSLETDLQKIDFFKENFPTREYSVKLLRNRASINIFDKKEFAGSDPVIVKKIKISRRGGNYTFDKLDLPSLAIAKWLENGESITLPILQNLPEYKKLENSTLKLMSTPRQLKNLTFIFYAYHPWIATEQFVEIYRSGTVHRELIQGYDRRPFTFDRNTIDGWKSAFTFTYHYMQSQGVVLYHKNPKAIEKAADLGLI